MHTGFCYRPEDHSYWLAAHSLPNVTTIIGAISNGYAAVPHHVLERKRDLGSKVHLACAFDDQGILDVATVDMAIEPYLAAWRSFRADSGFTQTSIEEPGYSKQYLYAGTPDRIGTIAGALAVIDLKCVAELKPETGLQLAAYSQLVLEMHGIEPKHRFAVQLLGTGGYRLQEYTDRADWKVFLSALQIFLWKKRYHHPTGHDWT